MITLGMISNINYSKIEDQSANVLTKTRFQNMGFSNFGEAKAPWIKYVLEGGVF